LSDLMDSNSLSMQLHTVSLNGVSTHNLVENFVQLFFKLFDDMQQLHQNNKHLKDHLSKVSASAHVSLVSLADCSK
jgi:hypothetical protein